MRRILILKSSDFFDQFFGGILDLLLSLEDEDSHFLVFRTRPCPAEQAEKDQQELTKVLLFPENLIKVLFKLLYVIPSLYPTIAAQLYLCYDFMHTFMILTFIASV